MMKSKAPEHRDTGPPCVSPMKRWKPSYCPHRGLRTVLRFLDLFNLPNNPTREVPVLASLHISEYGGTELKSHGRDDKALGGRVQDA